MSRLIQTILLRSRAIHFLNPFRNLRESKNFTSGLHKIVDFNPEKDVVKNYVLYEADYIYSLRKYQLISFGSFGVWLYLAMFVRDYVTDEPISIERMKIQESGRDEDSKLYSTWSSMTHVEDKYKWSLVIFSVFMAYGSLFITGIYISKCIQRLTLLRGGSQVLVETPSSFSFLPKLIAKRYPVASFSSVVSREHAKSYIPIKIKGKPLYFLLKTNGEFPNPLLFEKTVGRKRKL